MVKEYETNLAEWLRQAPDERESDIAPADPTPFQKWHFEVFSTVLDAYTVKPVQIAA